MSDSLRERFVSSSREQWAAIVTLALACSSDRLEQEVAETLARETSTNAVTLKRKFEAIRYARERGLDEFSIISNGQSQTLSNYMRARKRANSEKQRMLRWRVPASLADAIQSVETSDGQEEALQTRLVRVIKLKTSEDFWEFINSVFSDLSDADLLHLCGEHDGKRKRVTP